MKCGSYRCVICIGKYAIKLPRLTQLAKGLRCNQWENEIWKVWRPIFGWEHLCPIIAAAPFSLFVVMRKANQPVSFAEVQEADNCYDYYPDAPMEYKPENWGKVEGKVVCLDYGIDNANLIDKERDYLESKKNVSKAPNK